jgi:hypothetical protein
MKQAAIKATVKYTYDEFIELAIYADLTSTLKPSNKITAARDSEYEDIIDRLKENNIPFEIKSKREVVIVQ